MQLFDYRTTFTTMNLVFLELDTHHCHLGFKLLEKQKRNYAKYILSPAIK